MNRTSITRRFHVVLAAIRRALLAMFNGARTATISNPPLVARMMLGIVSIAATMHADPAAAASTAAVTGTGADFLLTGVSVIQLVARGFGIIVAIIGAIWAALHFVHSGERQDWNGGFVRLGGAVLAGAGIFRAGDIINLGAAGALI